MHATWPARVCLTQQPPPRSLLRALRQLRAGRGEAWQGMAAAMHDARRGAARLRRDAPCPAAAVACGAACEGAIPICAVLRRYTRFYAITVAGIIMFGGLVSPILEVKLGLGGERFFCCGMRCICAAWNGRCRGTAVVCRSMQPAASQCTAAACCQLLPRKAQLLAAHGVVPAVVAPRLSSVFVCACALPVQCACICLGFA